MRTRHSSIGTLLLGVCLALLAAGPLSAQTLAKGADYANIAPNPIPVSETGAAGIAVLKLDLSETAGTAAHLWEITVAINGSDTLGTADISNVRVYLNDVTPDKFTVPPGTNSGEITVTNIDKTTTPGSLILTLNGSDADATVPASATDRSLWIAFDYAAGIRNKTTGYQITSIGYSASSVSYTPATSSPLAPGALATTKPIRNYEVTFVASGLEPGAPWTEQENAENVEVLLLEFGGAGDEAVTKEIETITISNLGYDGYVIGNGIGVYLDDGDGVYENGIDIAIGAASLAGGEATITTVLGNVNAQFSTTMKQYLVTVTLGEADPFVAGRTIELQIANPKVDITFRDFVADSGANLVGQYLQTGYITATAATPTTQNAFEVTEYIAPDITPPSVVATVPPNGGTLDELDSPVVIYFSEDVQGADVLGSYTFEDIDGAPIAFTVAYSNTGGEYTATLQPSAPLDYETFYTVTVLAAGISDYATPAPNVMATDKEITFGTGLEFPLVSEPTVVKNRIVTGGNDEMVILIPEPAGGAGAKVTVQVFTATGKLVRSFYRNVAYSTITDGRIRWDGTNDAGKDLGPGVYFVQVRTAEYKRALKVMIVR